MPKFNEEEFYEIYHKVLREDLPVPFTCHILLKLSERAIPFIMKNTTVGKDRLLRLEKHGHQKLYIRVEDKQKYFEYLDQFLATENGKIQLKELAGEDGRISIQGFPDPGEYVLRNGPAGREVVEIVDGVVPPESEEGQTDLGEIEQVATETEDESSAVVAGVETPAPAKEETIEVIEPPQTAFGSIQVQGGISEAMAKVLKEIKNRTGNLEQGLSLRDTATEEDKQTIKDVTLKIEDELVTVNGYLDDPRAHKEALKKSALTLEEHLKRMSPLSNKYGQLKEFVQVVQEKLNEANEAVETGIAEKLRPSFSRVKTEVIHVKSLFEKDESEMVGLAISDIIGSVEQALGRNLNLQLSHGVQVAGEAGADVGWIISDLRAMQQGLKTGELEVGGALGAIDNLILRVEQAANQLNLSEGLSLGGTVPPETPDTKIDPSEINETHLEGTGLVDPQLMANLKGELETQKKYIENLTEKLKMTRPEFDAIKEQWFAFQVMTKRKLDGSDQLKVRNISQNLKDFETRMFGGVNDERKHIKEASLKLQGILDKQVLENMDVELAKDDRAILGSSAVLDEAQEAGEENEYKNNASELERLMAENKILQVQLENAQALMDTTNQKMEDLEASVRKESEYAESLEVELAEAKKKGEELLEETQEFESAKRRFEEALEEGNTKLYRHQLDQGAVDEKSAVLQDRIAELEKSLRVYQEAFGVGAKDISPEVEAEFPPEARRALMAREKNILELNKKLTRQLDQVVELKKELEGIKSADRKFDIERRELGKRLEKQRVQLENMKQHQKGQDVKINLTTNLLSQARRTVAKLTTESEVLRRDRTKYIRKTNEAMAEHKALLSQAMTLNNKVEQETERAKQFENALLQAKEREKKLAQQLKDYHVGANKFEVEKKKMEQDLRRLEGSVPKHEFDNLSREHKELEKKMEFFKRENRELQTKFAQEQKRVLELAQALKKVG